MTDSCSIENKRSRVKSGDLLAWSSDQSDKGFNFFLPLVRFMTASEFGHVGIAHVVGDEVHVFEATHPALRRRLIPKGESFYCCSMNVDWTEEHTKWFWDKLGCEYSYSDAIRAYLGLTVKDDDRWQCAELAQEFYKFCGISLNGRPTPTEIVDRALLFRCASLIKIR